MTADVNPAGKAAMQEHLGCACSAMLFVLEQAWDGFSAWLEGNTGLTPSREDLAESLAGLNTAFDYLDRT